MKTLEELSHNSFYDMRNHSQITIDLIEEAEDLGEDREEWGALCYRISILLEVINPELKTDIEALSNLLKIAQKEHAETQKINTQINVKQC